MRPEWQDTRNEKSEVTASKAKWRGFTPRAYKAAFAAPDDWDWDVVFVPPGGGTNYVLVSGHILVKSLAEAQRAAERAVDMMVLFAGEQAALVENDRLRAEVAELKARPARPELPYGLSGEWFVRRLRDALRLSREGNPMWSSTEEAVHYAADFFERHYGGGHNSDLPPFVQPTPQTTETSSVLVPLAGAAVAIPSSVSVAGPQVKQSPPTPSPAAGTAAAPGLTGEGMLVRLPALDPGSAPTWWEALVCAGRLLDCTMATATARAMHVLAYAVREGRPAGEAVHADLRVPEGWTRQRVLNALDDLVHDTAEDTDADWNQLLRHLRAQFESAQPSAPETPGLLEALEELREGMPWASEHVHRHLDDAIHRAKTGGFVNWQKRHDEVRESVMRNAGRIVVVSTSPEGDRGFGFAAPPTLPEDSRVLSKEQIEAASVLLRCAWFGDNQDRIMGIEDTLRVLGLAAVTTRFRPTAYRDLHIGHAYEVMGGLLNRPRPAGREDDRGGAR